MTEDKVYIPLEEAERLANEAWSLVEEVKGSVCRRLEGEHKLRLERAEAARDLAVQKAAACYRHAADLRASLGISALMAEFQASLVDSRPEEEQLRLWRAWLGALAKFTISDDGRDADLASLAVQHEVTSAAVELFEAQDAFDRAVEAHPEVVAASARFAARLKELDAMILPDKPEVEGRLEGGVNQ